MVDGALGHTEKTIILITHDVDEAILLSDRVYVLSARPAEVNLVMEVNLSRPRDFKNVTDPDFIQLKSRLLALLHTESSQESFPENPEQARL